jgi:hypothetical protein
MQYVNRSKVKSHMILSIDVEKSLWQDPTRFHDKLSKEIRNRRFLNIIKVIYNKPRVNIMLNGEQLKPFPLKSGMRQGSPLSPLLFNVVWEFLTRQEQEIKGIQ